MNRYERFVELMKKCGESRNPMPPMIGIVGRNGKIMLDDLTLDKDDYLIDCNLRFEDDEKMYYHTSTSSESSIKEYKRNILQEGDKVLALKLFGQELYIIMAKVVSAV